MHNAQCTIEVAPCFNAQLQNAQQAQTKHLLYRLFSLQV